MAIDKRELHNESPILRKIRLLTYPVIFSLLSVLNANAEEPKNIQPLTEQTTPVPAGSTTDEQTTARRETDEPIDAITDSTFLKAFEDILNKLTKSDLTPLQREKLNKDIIGRLSFYFDDSDDPLKNTPKEDMYVTRNGTTHPLPRFLSTFYKESYRGA